jgi:hypothetical protein
MQMVYYFLLLALNLREITPVKFIILESKLDMCKWSIISICRYKRYISRFNTNDYKTRQ